jgi:hypothetical protein
MTHGAARMGLAATVAVAFIGAAAVLPAAAQQKMYPAGTDCTKLVGNDKASCEHQSKNTASPDNANNPDNSAINTSNPPAYEQQPIGAPSAGAAGNGMNNNMPASTTYPSAQDCTHMVGTSKTECEQRSKNSPSPDNSNNPDTTN